MASTRAQELINLLFQAHPWHGVPIWASDDVLNVYVEIVPGDTVKYELDKPSGHLRLDRPQRFSSMCPMPYGFVPQTYCGAKVAERTREPGMEGDGDPLDICVITEKAVTHGNFLLRARPIGGLRMIDGNQADDKILAVLADDVTFGHLRELSECPVGVVDRLSHYFLSYKRPPGEVADPRVRIAERYGRKEALEVIRASGADYREKFGPPETRLDELRALISS
jgi:inorganic pyrophosphatase